VIPSVLGEQVYLRVGFKEIDGLLVVPDDGDQKGFSQKIFLYESKDSNTQKKP
jgi:hypothetical protein